MHEWALAEAVLDAAAASLRGRDPSRLRGVTIVLGELQAVDRSIFDEALATLLRERPFRDAAFTVETEPAAFACAGCGTAWTLAEAPGLTEETRESIHFLPEAAFAFVRCPSCGGPDFSVRAGRGVSLRDITLLEGPGEGAS